MEDKSLTKEAEMDESPAVVLEEVNETNEVGRLKLRYIRRPLLTIFLIIIMLIGIVAGTILVQRSQDIRGDAAGKSAKGSKSEYDVVVVGASTGGVSAAIQAARSGAKVALIEETDWIGGQMTAAAVSTMDGNPDFASGIYAEYITKIKNHYEASGKSISTCYWSGNSICFEPSVGQDVLNEMISDVRETILPDGRNAVLDVFLRTSVRKVQSSGNKVTGVITNNGNFKVKVVIEATEYGDVLAQFPSDYRAGNTISPNLNTNACVQDITYTAVIKKYESVPTELQINNPPPGYSQEVENEFSKIVSTDGSVVWDGQTPVNWNVHTAYRGLPDSSNPASYDASNPENYSSISKTVINWANDYKYSVANLDKEGRKEINCQAKLKTLQFLYYVQNVLGESNWSIANDEGFDTPYNLEENLCANIPQEYKSIEKHFPVKPYIREGRRGLGEYVLTAKDLYREGDPPRAREFFSDSIAVGDYPVDLHACKSETDLEQELELQSDYPEGFISGPFQVPLGSLIPRNIDGLILAEKNLSMSRLANGALRLQPITMLTGQAAGELAALAVAQNIQPREVDVKLLQGRLINSGSMLYGFSDTKGDHLYFGQIQKIVIDGYMSGYGDSWGFGPDNLLTRAEIAVVLTRLNELSIEEPEIQTFEDVASDSWYYKWVETLFKSGLTAGCSETPKLYCPDNNVTREELSVFMVKSAGEEPYSGSEESFSDVPASIWSHKWIEKAVQLGLMEGVGDGKFDPQRDVTRGEIAKTLYDVLVYLGRVSK